MPERIRYTADVAVLRGGDLLLIERGWAPHEGKLALPGGHVDPGETSRDAAVRELWEETGVDVDAEDLTLLGVWDAPDRDPRGRYVTVVYTVHVPADTTARAGDDASAVRWVPLHHRDQLRDLDRMNADYEAQDEAEWLAYLDGREGRCAAAHPEDPSVCCGPAVVTVVDDSGYGVDGCEAHAAAMLASTARTRVYALPDAPDGAAIRTFRWASGLPAFPWRTRTPRP